MKSATVQSLRVVVVAPDERVFASVRDALDGDRVAVARWSPGAIGAPGAGGGPGATGATGVRGAPGTPPVQPDVLILQGEAVDVPALLGAGERDGWRMATIPVLVLAGSPLEREDRRSWLEAGAWEIVGLPVDPEPLRLQVRNLTRAFGPDEADGVAEKPYARTALVRATGESLALAHRSRRPLSAAGFSLDWGSRRADPDGLAVLHRLAHIADEAARGSDLVGITADGAIVVLLPDTPDAGAAVFTERLAAQLQEGLREWGVLGQILAGHITADLEVPSEPDAFLRAAASSAG